MMLAPRLWGSVGGDLTGRYVTPFDTGWENRIHWDHEFTGKAALASIAASPPRTVVTLEWNADDIADVHASQYRGLDEEPYMPLDLTGPSDVMYDSGTPDPATGLPKTKDYHADLVLTPDGQEIGISAGRIVSTTYRRMISLAFISREHADLGTELVVLWGNPGTRRNPSARPSPASRTSPTSATTRSTSSESPTTPNEAPARGHCTRGPGCRRHEPGLRARVSAQGRDEHEQYREHATASLTRVGIARAFEDSGSVCTL